MGKLPRSYLALALAAALSTAAALALTERAEGQPSGRDDVSETVHALDELCAHAWSRANVQPSREADALLIMRRLSLALTGAAPSLQEIRRSEDAPPDERIERHLEGLLASRRFADYWAERLARAYVGVEQGPFLVFRRRRFVQWLSDALHDSMAYDELVRRMVASNGLWTDRPETNFITAHERDPVRLAARTTRAFLGMRLDCAQCHDHPFAHWKQADFEGLAAHYAGVTQTMTGIVDGPERFKPGGRMMMRADTSAEAEPRVPFAQSARPADGTPRQQLAAWITSPDNDAFGRAIVNRVWTMMLGRSLTRGGVDDIESSERVEGALALLASDFVRHGYDLRRLIHVVAHSRAFRLTSTAGADDASESFAAFPMTKLRAEQIAGSLVQLSSLETVDADAHVVWKLVKTFNLKNFVERYGEAGESELDEQAGTIMQRLVMMNGRIVRERIEANLFSAAGRIAALSPDDDTRVRVAYLLALTREPDEHEAAHFAHQLRQLRGKPRNQAMEDMLWSLVNATEFSWNH